MNAADRRPPARLVLIDDDKGQLALLKAALEKEFGAEEVAIDLWQPELGDVRATLIEKLEPRPTLVVTDHDLTGEGAAGLLGGSVISWCRAHAIPVGDYSNKLKDDLEEPDLFEFRFPSVPDDAAAEIAELLLGFRDLARLLEGRDAVSSEGWSQTLASALNRPEAASAFSLYSARAGASHLTAIERLTDKYGEQEARRLLEVYVVGHLLHNGVLRHAGPIMSDLVLCSYLAIADDKLDVVSELFHAARYDGPFGRKRRFFWHESVDDALYDLADAAQETADMADDQARRALIARHFDPGTHPCDHCGGERGGFRCPYTDRTKCDQAKCSVPTTSWIPPGAYLVRVDKDYFERWSPLLGL